MSNKSNGQNPLRTEVETQLVYTSGTKEGLEASCLFFSTLAQISPVGIFRTDEQGNCIYVNERWCEIAGMARIDALAGGWERAIHPDDRDEVAQAWYLSTQANQNFNMEYRFQRPDGMARWVLEQATAERNAAGDLVGYVGTITDITERKVAEDKIRQYSEELVALLKISQEFAATLDLQSVLQTATDRVAELSELKSSAIYLLEGETLRLWAATPPLPPEFPDELRNMPLADHPHIRKAITTGMPVFMPDTASTDLTPAEQAVTELRDLRSILYLPLLAGTKVTGTLIVATVAEPRALSEAQIDLCRTLANIAALAVENARLYQSRQHYAFELEQRIIEREQAEKVLRESEERWKFALEGAGDGVWDANFQSGETHYSRRWKEILGFAENEIANTRDEWAKRIHPEDAPELMADIQAHIEGKKASTATEFRMSCKDGSWKWVSGRGMLVSRDVDGKPLRIIGTITDISERKHAEEQIRQLANFDSLTGLPNRTLFNDRISQAISMAQRSQSKLAVVFVDLDHFKNINDTLGHRTGDALLKEVAKRMKSSLREEDTVSRMGGDEFILLLPDTDAEGAAHVAKRLLWAVSQHYQFEEHELLITPSIGIALYPSDGEDSETLSMRADAAMYRAKRDGRNNYRFFTSGMQARSARNMQLENALRRVLERNQLHLHYQPQISLESGNIIGAEALLRWQHPELGLISPDEFIPIAEDNGLILPIGEWVLRSAVRQLRTWMDGGIAPMIIAVNLSAVQFRHSHLPELVSQILEEEGVPPQFLELELTESVAMNNPLGAIAVMDNLHARGVRMSIDDFGTGYSSLSYLKRFQVYKLKIDQSFVRDITEDPEDKAIVAAIISMANSLGMQTIAEGVELEGQLDFLREKGCSEVQGYYYSKPLPPEQFEAFALGKS